MEMILYGAFLVCVCLGGVMIFLSAYAAKSKQVLSLASVGSVLLCCLPVLGGARVFGVEFVEEFNSSKYFYLVLGGFVLISLSGVARTSLLADVKLSQRRDLDVFSLCVVAAGSFLHWAAFWHIPFSLGMYPT